MHVQMEVLGARVTDGEVWDLFQGGLRGRQ